MNEEWYMGYDRKSGNPYYFNNVGDVSYQTPEGYMTPPQNNSSSFRSGNQSIRLTRFTNSSSNSSSRSGSSRNYMRQQPQQQQPRQQPQQSINRFTNPAVKQGRNGMPLRVLYAHVARYEDELTLRPGQTVIGLEKKEGGTWWFGELNGRQGHFPANFVEEIPANMINNNNAPAPSRGRGLSFAGFRKTSIKNTINPDPAYGASPSGWYNGGNQMPQRPPKPEEIAANNVPRDMKAQIKDEKKAASNPLKWTFLAHNWGYAFALFAIVTGGFAVFWFMELNAAPPNSEKRRLLWTQEFSGPAVFAAGVISFLFEYFYGLKKTDKHIVYARPMLYLVLAIPCFTSFVSILTGIIGVITAGLNFIADRNEERGTSPAKSYMFRFSLKIFMGWSCTQATIVIVFVLINVGLFLTRFLIVENERIQCIEDAGGVDLMCITQFAPFAKGFGTSLDFTCAFIVVPVLRAFIKKFSNIQLGPNKTMATALPLKKTLQFHKIIGFAIFVGSAGHIFFHFTNFALAPEAAIATFGSPALYTGGVLTLLMVIIFCAAHESVRRSNFEAFWYSHNAFLFVFPILLAHGPKYWIFAAIPIPLYAIDRLIRANRGTKPMFVDYVRFQSPVLKLHFFPEKRSDFVFRSGQYLYLQCPHINEHEWHPFTISSSPGDLDKLGFVSLHIRIQGEGSWTHQLYDYFKMLSGAGGKKPKEGYEKYLTHFDNAGVVQRGKRYGPDGLPLVRIDGPHSAPAQTYSFYDDVMLVGSGIGLTPSASILSSVTRYKWAKGFTPHTLRFYWVVRHSEIDSFEWFIELLTDISKRVLADRKNGAITSAHRLDINIYVTRAPKTNETQKDRAKAAQKNELEMKQKKGVYEGGIDFSDVDIGFTMDDIKSMLKNPMVPSKQQAYSQQYSFGNRLGPIQIWNGRPEWKDIFEMVKQTRAMNVSEVGVVYCGAPVIGNDLKANCHKFSGNDCQFTLNKEVF